MGLFSAEVLLEVDVPEVVVGDGVGVGVGTVEVSLTGDAEGEGLGDGVGVGARVGFVRRFHPAHD